MLAAIESSAQWTSTLPIPLTLPGTQAGNVMQYNLTMDSTSFVFFPGGQAMPTYSFNNSGLLGPTIIWNTGDSVQMNVTNNLSSSSTVHWHGAHVPARADGGPHDTIAAGATWSPKFKILDNAATMWYHPHLHEHTLEQVQMGLAGLIIINDPNDPFQALLPTTYGEDDIPLILQDKAFDVNGADSTLNVTCTMGPVAFVNGAYKPVVTVPAQMVRFRLLNGASERVFAPALKDGSQYTIIATDAGYTAAPITQNTPMPLASGERVEWVLDLTSRQGDTLYITNFPTTLGTSVPGGPTAGTVPGCYTQGPLDSVNTDMIMIIVGPPSPTPVTSLPAAFNPLTPPSKADSDRTRTKNLVFAPNNTPPFLIDNNVFEMETINDTILLNDIEIWEIINSSGVAHPFHIHDIHFYILDVNSDTILPAHLQGPKDVVLVENGDTVRFITQFTTFDSPLEAEYSYMYHCHILSHEDGGMMQQFVVIDPTAVGVEAKANSAGWQLYPNPAYSTVTLKGESETASTVNIFDAKGALAKTIALPAFKGTQTLNVQDLPAGLWLVQWSTANGISSQRLIIE